MRKSTRFTRKVATVLALVMLDAPMAGAVSPLPGSLAVLEPPMSLPDMRAVWDGIRSDIYLDPLLLVKGREEVLKELEDWHLAGLSVRTAYQTADRVTLDQAQALIEEAWTLYFQFDYNAAAEALGRSEKLLVSSSGDSAFRTSLMFEAFLVSGLVARAGGDKNYTDHFKRAAALDPARELSSLRYSPETIGVYNRIRRELTAGGSVPLRIEGTPDDALILVGGQGAGEMTGGAGFELLPGQHFIEASAPGYEPWGMTLDMRRFEPAEIRFELIPTGPEGDPDAFFLQRLRAGDRPYMVLLAEKLGVDYLLVPDTGEGVLSAWLINREGRSVGHAALWENGEARESGVLRIARLLEPLRQQWDPVGTTVGAPVTLPGLNAGLPEESMDAEGNATWSRYAIAIGVLILVGFAASADKGGGTRVEATW